MPQHRFKKLKNGVWNPFEGTVGFSQQFWGEHIYAIQSDTVPTESVYAALDKSNATEVHTKMKISRGYDTFCPVQCGIADDKNPRIFFGGTASVTKDVFTQALYRDDSFLYSKIVGETDGYFGLYLGGYYGQTAFNEIIAFKSSNGNADGHTVGQPVLWRISSDITGHIEAPDLEIYLVYSVSDDCYYWCVRSILNNYYRYWICEYGYAVYAEDDDTGEKEEDVLIPIPNLPTLGVANVGVRLYRASDYSALLSYMWGTDGFYNTINKLLGDQTPYECIVAFNVVPYGEAFPIYSKADIVVGNVNTHVQAPMTGQYAEINFGTVKIPRRFNNALDFAPYTNVELFLPFIGRVKLPTDFVMDKTIGVVYHMDAVSGGCFAYITIDDIGVFQCEGGSCLIQLPISAQTANGARQSISSAMAAGASFASAGSVGSTITLPKSGKQITTYGESDVLSGTSQALSGVNQAWSAIAAKDSYSTFGGLSLANGFLGLSNPVVYIHRPINATPSGYNNIAGYPASEIANLGNLSGFTQVKSINLGIAGASQEDLDEIEMLLKEGVIL